MLERIGKDELAAYLAIVQEQVLDRTEETYTTIIHIILSVIRESNLVPAKQEVVTVRGTVLQFGTTEQDKII